MALEAGGYADKLGNRYEANWVAYQLLQLLDEKILSVIVEPIGDDEIGVDVVIERHNGEKEYHQCKVGNANSEYWTLAQLNQAKIITKGLFQIQRGMNEFHLVSPLTSKRLSDLSDSALNTSGDVTEFYEYQVKISNQREKDFNDLCAYLGLNRLKELDLEQALFFLQRFKITPYVINKHTVCELEDKATALFSGVPSKLLQFLKNYPVELNKLRVKITTSSLLSDLEKNGFYPRIKPDDKRVFPILERISKDFTNSIKPYLISNTLIRRNEADDVIDSLKNHAVTLIKAEAGMGKSSLLLDLHERLQSQAAISVPIRLDRNRPENNADEFGVKLGFPYSPVLCLSRFTTQQKMVVILDQLDAIRWTATHSNNALQVCQELVRQVLALRKEGVDISVVLACRGFDLDEDVALSSWVNELDNEVAEVIVSNLDTKTVTQLIEPFEKFEALSEEKKKILTIPLWLSIYLVIAQRIKAAPQFTNKLELVKRFWDDRIGKVVSLGVSEEKAKQLIDEVVVLMSSKSRLSVSENVIAISSPQTLNALLSVGIFTKQSQYISFRHQALFDYQVGLRLFNVAISSTDGLINEIGEVSQQNLTKREHLKYALNMLLDYDQDVFCRNALAILTSDKIRFHLKHLVFNSIKELSLLKKSAKVMLVRIAKNTELLPYFITNSCYNNHHIISFLFDSGILTSWLISENDELIEKTIRLLSSIAEKSPDTVLKALTPFIGKSDEWNNRVYSGLCWDMENDSDNMFSTRTKLINLGCNGRFVNWSNLAKEKPGRALELVEMLLLHYKDTLFSADHFSSQKLKKLTHRDDWSESEYKGLSNISLVIPEKVLLTLLAAINDSVGGCDGENVNCNWFYSDRYSSHDTVSTITKGVVSLIESAAEELSNTPDTLLEIVTPYLSSNNLVITYLTAKLLNHLPVEYSNLVIKWLLEDPDSRFRCGNTYVEPKWKLPGRLIERFSVKCSDELFQTLENRIYYFGSDKSLDEIKWRLEARREGVYYSFWGETQYFLLPLLANTRISNKASQLVSVLRRKFETYTEDDFCDVFSSRGGIVTSPLPLANVLSDNAWKNLILGPKERTNNGRWVQDGVRVVSESSIEQFSRSLNAAVINQPSRFASLALSLPSNIDIKYIQEFYYGLGNTDIKRVNEEYRDDWKLCPVELTEQVISHFENTGCEYQLVRVLESRIKEKGWSENAKRILIELAINAEDPKPSMLNIRNMNKSESPDDTDVGSLRSNAINCCRGIAYRGVSQLFWENEGEAGELQYLVQSAIDDPHPAVNIVALDMLLPIWNYDQNYALTMFLKLCDKDLRMACGDGAHHFFNNGFDGPFKEGFISLVLKMLKSPFDEIKKEAARQVIARWFFDGLFRNQITTVMQGDDTCREGVASVVSQLLCEDKYHDCLYKLPPIYAQLVEDENKEVQRMVGQVVNNDNFWKKNISKELFEIFVGSKAVLHCFYELFEAIEKHTGSMLDYQYQLLKLVENITLLEKSDNSISGMGVRDSSLIKVLQKLYDEATEDEDPTAINICLDIWDKLLRSEIYSTINLSPELEKGLLG